MGRAGAGAVLGGRAEWPSRGVRACASARRARAQSVHATGMLHGTPQSSACASLLNRLQVYLTLQGGFICRTPSRTYNFTEMYWERLAPCDSTV